MGKAQLLRSVIQAHLLIGQFFVHQQSHLFAEFLSCGILFALLQLFVFQTDPADGSIQTRKHRAAHGNLPQGIHPILFRKAFSAVQQQEKLADTGQKLCLFLVPADKLRGFLENIPQKLLGFLQVSAFRRREQDLCFLLGSGPEPCIRDFLRIKRGTQPSALRTEAFPPKET